MRARARTDYDRFFDRLRAAVAPRNAIEELWVRDIADLSWESLRLRRLKAKLMVSARSKALFRLLDRLVEEVDEESESDDTSDSDAESEDVRDIEDEDVLPAYWPYDDEERN